MELKRLFFWKKNHGEQTAEKPAEKTNKQHLFSVKGVTKRWISNSLFVTALVLLALCVISITAVVSYYRSYVETLLSGNANENVTTFFQPYLTESDDNFAEKAKEYVDGFTDKSLMEVMVIDKYGKVSVSSSGFQVSETADTMTDVQRAKHSASGISHWTGRNANGEHVMAVAMVFPSSGGQFSGAVRFVTSLKNVDVQLFAFSGVVLGVFVVALALVVMSGLFFIQSIVAPVRRINDATKHLADGDYNIKIDISDDNNDEITELAQSMNHMIDELSETDRMKNDFISTVSHELRTPLTAIKGWGEMLRELDGEDRELARRGSDVIISESERLSTLVEELLDFSRIQNGSLSLRLEKIDVLAELDETIFVFKERSKRDGIALTYNVPDAPAPMMADPNRIKQVFVNILDNAFKYSEPGGKVEVDAVLGDGSLSVIITDHGCGIPPEDLPNVKMKFFKSNLQVRGSGIGLAVVDEIVKQHNGIFDIQSEVGVGTVVTIVLPVEKVVLEEPASLAEEVAKELTKDQGEQNAEKLS